MLRARTIVYAITISLFIFILLGSFFAVKYYNSLLLVKQKTGINLENICNSAMLYYKYNSGLFPYNSLKKVELPDSFAGEAFIKRSNWGAYDIIEVKSQLNNFTKSKVSFNGTNPQQYNALYVTDNNNYVIAEGSTKLKGLLQVPGALIKRDKFYGSIKPTDTIRYSEKQLPRINNTISQYARDILKVNLTNYKVFNLTEELPVKLDVSFLDSGLVYLSDNTIYLDEVNYSGKIILSSAKEIIVSKNCILNDIIISAPAIRVKSGFEGSLQLFSNSSIIIEKDCKFNYPSFIGMFSDNTVNIEVPGGASIAGGVVLISKNKEPHNTSAIVLERLSTVYGVVYTTNNLVIKGDVYGSVYANYVMPMKTGNANLNIIRDVTIDPTQLKSIFAYPVLFEGFEQQEIVNYHSSTTLLE